MLAILLIAAAPFVISFTWFALDNMDPGLNHHETCVDPGPRYHGPFHVADIVLVNSTTNETISEDPFFFDIGLCNATSCEGYYIYFHAEENINGTLSFLSSIPEDLWYNTVWLKVVGSSTGYGYQTLLPGAVNCIRMQPW